MIRDVILPQLAMGMSEGTIVNWVVSEGAVVQKEQALLSIETEKVTTELPAPYSGYVHHIARAGDVFPVETVIAKIAETEEDYRNLTGATNEEPVPAITKTVVTDERRVGGVGDEMPSHTGRVIVSGLARGLARKSGIDLSTVRGTGPRGRIIRRDVVGALEARRSSAVASARTNPEAYVSRERTRIPLTGMRGAIADRMVRAKTTAAHTYAFFEFDATKLLDVRKTFLEREKQLGLRVSMLSLYVRALALACRQVPICNSTLSEREITVWDNVNVGVAVAIAGRGPYDSGLVVPVVVNADEKGVLEIDREIKVLIDRARNGELTAAEMANGTITVSSTSGFTPGTWSISTPLLNLPQVVNFQPGSPIEKPVIVDGNVVVRSMLPCGLSFDHRAVDGEPVGQFIRGLVDLLSNPELMTL